MFGLSELQLNSRAEGGAILNGVDESVTAGGSHSAGDLNAKGRVAVCKLLSLIAAKQVSTFLEQSMESGLNARPETTRDPYLSVNFCKGPLLSSSCYALSSIYPYT